MKESATGGEVALEGDEKEARPQAEGYMRGRCGTPGYQIVREGETPGAGSFRGANAGWRISYTCNPKDPHEGHDDDEHTDAAEDASATKGATWNAPDGGKSGKSRWDR